MAVKNIKQQFEESALLRFLESQDQNEADSRRITDSIADIKDLWLLAKMAKAVRHTALG